jgi:hypothetical protein
MIARLYSKDEVVAEVPDVVRRLNAALPAGNPTRALANSYIQDNKVVKGCNAAELSHLIALGHEAADRNRAKLRTFRNVMLFGTLVMAVILACIVTLVAYHHDLMPLCFEHEADPESKFEVACPTRDGPGGTAPSGGDVFAISLMGLVGGALSSAIFIRGMGSNPTPYNLAIPLALLKLPFGGLTALVGVLLLAGDFVPGFTAVDKQQQILAYAVVFGFAQQFFTRYLDERAEKLIAGLPAKSRNEPSKASAANSAATPMTTVD